MLSSPRPGCRVSGFDKRNTSKSRGIAAFVKQEEYRVTELSTLERKRLSDLHQIASQLGIEQYRKYRKPELAQMIYKVATEQAAEQAAGRQDGPPLQTAPEAPASNGEADAAETREAASAAQAPVMDGFGEADTAVVEDATEVEKYRRERGQEETPQRQEQRPDRGGGVIQNGVL